jgi:hypothetical protein
VRVGLALLRAVIGYLMVHTVDSSVAVLVCLSNHLVDFIVGQLLADGGHDMSQLGGGDESIVVTIKDLESFCLLLDVKA